jgi:chromosome segregation ATPase
MSTEDKNQARTTGEGIGIGAAIGGVIGLILGDNKESVAIGAAIGGIIGGAVGGTVAAKKKQYATQEALLEGETKKTAEVVAQLRKVNNGLRSEIAVYKSEIAQLQEQRSKGQAKQSELQAQREKVLNRHQDANKALVAVNKELELAQELYSDAKEKVRADDVNTAKLLKKYEQEIAALEREKSELENYSNELSAMGTAIAF